MPYNNKLLLLLLLFIEIYLTHIYNIKNNKLIFWWAHRVYTTLCVNIYRISVILRRVSENNILILGINKNY